jgi:hypothetical protein
MTHCLWRAGLAPCSTFPLAFQGLFDVAPFFPVERNRRQAIGGKAFGLLETRGMTSPPFSLM